MLDKIKNKVAPQNIVDAFKALYQEGRFDDILSPKYSQLIKLYPDTPDLHNILGAISFKRENKIKAKKHFQKVIELLPNDHHAYNNLGATLIDLEDFNGAQNALYTAIKIYPNYAEAYNNLGNSLYQIKKYKQAIFNYQKAIELNQDFFEAYNNLGITFEKNNQQIYAKNAFDKAIIINPQFAEAHNSLATHFINKGDYKNALIYIRKAIKYKPDFSEAYRNLALIYDEFGNYNLSSNHLSFARKLDPNLFKKDPSYILYNANYSPDMNSVEIFKLYKQFDQNFGLPQKSKWKHFSNTHVTKKKLKIGYVSPDLNNHSIQNCLLPILANHNKDKFEIFAFADLEEEDLISQQYKLYVDHWIRTEKMTDNELVNIIRIMQIDILVDLAGHTKGNRLGVFAQKPAPISISWLGYGYTSGLSAIDYFLTDNSMVPKGTDHLFTEKPWRLKNFSFCCYLAKSNMGEVNELPAIKNNFITFGSLTRAIRINDRVIKIWAQIMRRVTNSKLVINSKSFKYINVIEEFKKKFKLLGIEENRLNFYYNNFPYDTMREIDIALDCFPHNSGTTLLEHLYMGNPFVTYCNRASVGKIGASFLNSLGHKDWIAKSEKEYSDKVVLLASNQKILNKIRLKLRKEMLNSPLMNHKKFTQNLELNYLSMWKIYIAK